MTFTDHFKTSKHITAVIAKNMSTRLPGANTSDEHGGTYGVAPVYSQSCTTPIIEKQAVHILDRVSNLEAMLLAFIAEYNLPFTVAGSFCVE